MGSTVVEFMAAEAEEDKLAIVNRKVENLTAISSLIAELGPYIDGEASMEDCQKGATHLRLEFLLLVLQNVDPGKLSRHDLSALVEYLTNRVSQAGEVQIYRAGLLEIAKCLTTIAKMPRFIKSNASDIALAVFRLPDNKQSLNDFPHSTRLSLLNLLQCLLEAYPTALKSSLGSKFVDGITSMAAVERNPSCILAIFKIYSQLGKSWDINSDEAETLFGSFFRYFPITTTKSATPLKPEEDLKRGLLNCLISNDRFAPFVFPALFQKLDSESVRADIKIDVFDSMLECIRNYTNVSEFSVTIWDTLKWEVWNGENDDFINRSIENIAAIAGRLGQQSSSIEDDNGELAKFVNHVTQECVTIFTDDTKKRMILPCIRILGKISSTSPQAFTLTSRNTLPTLFTLWQGLDNIADKTRLLESFNIILETRANISQSSSPPIEDAHMAQRLATMDVNFDSLRESFVELYFGATSMSSSDLELKIATTKGLTLLATIRNDSVNRPFLNSFEQGTIIEKLNETAFDLKEADDLRSLAVASLSILSVRYPDTFINITLPNFIGKLPDQLKTEHSDESDLSQVVWLLDSLVDIACKSTCQRELEIPDSEDKAHFKFRLFKALQSELVMKFTHHICKYANQKSYQMALLAAIYRGLQVFDDALADDRTASELLSSSNDIVDSYAFIAIALFKRVIGLFQHETGDLKGSWFVGISEVNKGEYFDDSVIALVGTIGTYILRSNTTPHENNFLLKANADNPTEPSRVWTLFNFGAHTRADLGACQQDLRVGPSNKCSANILSTALIAGIRKEDIDRLGLVVHETAKSMLFNAISVENKCSRQARISMLQMLQLLVNKFGADKKEFEDGKQLHDVMLELVNGAASKPDLEAYQIYQALAYFAAAAVAAYEPCSTALIDAMMQGISDPKRGRKIARSFAILLAPSNMMNENNFCILRPLRFGRLYSTTVNQLITLWRSNEDNRIKENYLIALAGILRYMPAKIMQGNAAQILPIALAGTDVPDKTTKDASMNIMIVLMPENPGLIEEHLDSIINRMTDRTHNTYDSPSDANVEGRSKALDVLAMLPTLVENGLLLKRKNAVLKELDVALDDCSREVRMRADRCKMIWFNL
ncbi:putative dna repair transcription protein [Botrytis cinerea BcDW1]|uniref:MMS19 nucleotide excision repair protein n=1 Tax=Botryotinia fuckeliana (strain BcDW1) TaxID=1290391 RepID=M7UQ21_BOTF1|nr:putative dna repair transcription protein [Botrytis cinerea BcDW1]